MTARGRRLVILLATLVGVAATFELGLWQLHRAGQKEALQQAEDSQGKLAPLATQDLASTAALAASQHYRAVRLQGRWIPGATVFLDNRQMDGHPGFFVVTPLRLAGRDEAVLVQRGWAPRSMNDRAAVPAVVDAPGDVDVVGLLAPPPGRLYDFGSPGSGAIRQNLDLDEYGREVGVTLLPLSVLQHDSASTVGDGLQRRWPAPDLGIERHYGYVFQWWGLCALIAGLFVWFQLVKPAVASSKVHASTQALKDPVLANPETRLDEPRPRDA